MRGDASLGYDRLEAWLRDPASSVPAEPGRSTSDLEWWLAGARSRSAARPSVLWAFPGLARGIEAEEARDSDRFTRFDGFVPEAGPILDPSRTLRPVSPTSLEKAAKCPFRFFLEQGLGVKAIEEGKADADAWLDAATRGIELHDLFARVLRAVRNEKREPSLKIDRPRLLAWGTTRLAELKAEMPPPSEEVFARESQEFLGDLEAFIVAECEGRHGVAVGFEVSFGFRVEEEEDGSVEPLAREAPLVIDLGSRRRIVAHGRIDRINRVGDRAFEIVDYKTGRYWPDDWKGEFAGGTRLQHAMYGLAAQAALRETESDAVIVRGTYLFPSVRGHRRRKEIKAPPKAAVVRVLRDLADVIGDGAFAAADADGGCRWCDYAAACHAEGADRASGKITNEANAALDAYRRLRSHE
jgi:ATP-dependent helicase/nuclease subunit B